MKQSARRFYGSVSLFLIWISGVLAGITMAGYLDWGNVILEWGLMVAALAFGWVAIAPHPSLQTSITPEQLEQAEKRLRGEMPFWTGETRSILDGEARGIRLVAKHLRIGPKTPPK